MAKKGGKNQGEINKNVCMQCDAPCCRDITMLITRPRTKTERNELTQYLHFDTARVFVRNNKWYLTFEGKCMYLSRNNLCKKYTKRPPRCRRHNPPNCEHFAEWYDVLISTPEEFAEYMENISVRNRGH
jgi:hypothetical protein